MIYFVCVLVLLGLSVMLKGGFLFPFFHVFFFNVFFILIFLEFVSVLSLYFFPFLHCLCVLFLLVVFVLLYYFSYSILNLISYLFFLS